MSDQKAENPEVKDEDTDHGRRVMIKADGSYTLWKIEFDSCDGRGVAWQRGRGVGKSNTVEETTRHFVKKGYTVVEWSDV